jgi:hypothetical protein
MSIISLQEDMKKTYLSTLVLEFFFPIQIQSLPIDIVNTIVTGTGRSCKYKKKIQKSALHSFSEEKMCFNVQYLILYSCEGALLFLNLK